MMCYAVSHTHGFNSKKMANVVNEAAFSYLLVFLFIVALSTVETKDTEYVPWSRNGGRLQTITTVLIEPYVMKKNITSKFKELPVTEMYEGYLIDLLEQLSHDVQFNYHLFPTGDGSFGVKRGDGSWDGMIGELTRKEADIAAGPMFKTEKRALEVNFTDPYLYAHATMIMKKPSKGGLLDITSIRDLQYRTDIEFGTLDRGVIKKAFRSSKNNVHKKLLQIMNTFKPKAYTKTNAEGIERVRRDSNYIFIIPDTIGEYIASKHPCDLSIVDKFLMSEGYSLALQRGSHLLPYINRALKTLHKNGFLKKLYNKWWVEKADCDVGPSDKSFRSLDYGESVPQSQNSSNSGQANYNILSLNVVSILIIYLKVMCT